MRKSFGAKTWVYPMPVLILAAYGSDGIPMAMNAGWGGISGNEEISLCISREHKTTENIRRAGAFTVSMADAAHLAACDYVGIVSGNDVPDKVARAGFHTSRSPFVNAPILEELPLTLSCELVSYDPESGRLVGKIVDVSADEKILDESGRIDAGKADFLTLDPVTYAYRTVGSAVGQAFCDGNSLK